MFRLFFIGFMVTFSSLAAAGEWIEPGHWNEIGTVEEWMQDDSHFYRIEQLTGNLSSRFYDNDQQAVYRKTLQYDNHLPRLGLQAFLALPPERIAERRAEARDVLKQVIGFRNRMADLCMRVRANQNVGWGRRDRDPRVMEDLLERLQTATGLDPSDPYAWHLLAYLATSCGDRQRGLAALDSLDAALALLPTRPYEQMRRRARLDRAWLLRDLGRFAEAAGVLSAQDGGSPPNLETQVLQGLVAAQNGDTQTALRLASALDGTEIPVFQQDWEATSFFNPGVLDPMAWPTKPSGYLKGWILALTWLQEGNTNTAAKAFPEYSRMRHYFPFGSHFWNDAGIIYQATDRPKLAAKAWNLALMYTPYFPYMIVEWMAYDLSKLTGRPGDQPFALSYDTNFLAGDRLAYGASLLTMARMATDGDKQLELTGRAIEELEICRRSGLDKRVADRLFGFAHQLQHGPPGR